MAAIDNIADIGILGDYAEMKVYGVFPTFILGEANSDRVKASVSIVSDIVVGCLRAGGDVFHYVVDWRDPGAEAWQGCTDSLAEPHVIPLSDPNVLARLVMDSVDPFSGRSASVIRSIATCRAATFGWDGQAFLCLRHDDDPPISPDKALVVIEERPSLLTESDYFDGWLSQH